MDKTEKQYLEYFEVYRKPGFSDYDLAQAVSKANDFFLHQLSWKTSTSIHMIEEDFKDLPGSEYIGMIDPEYALLHVNRCKGLTEYKDLPEIEEKDEIEKTTFRRH